MMIRESEVKYCICQHVPSLAVELSHHKYSNDAYKAIDRLTDYTKAAIHEENANEIEECFITAYQLLHEGNRLVQLAVENIFVYSISRVLEISAPVAQSVRSMFLKSFEKEYSRLINSRNP